MKFVAIDFETANEQRDSVCAIGIAAVKDARVVQTVHHLVRPRELRFSPWNTRIHGISAEDVKDAPTLTDLWPTIRLFLENQLVVAHNASFEISVLRHSLYANLLPIPKLHYLCSLKLARAAWPELVSHSLSLLAAWRGIELAHHNPESDARAACEIVLGIARDRGVGCPFRLAASLGVTIGELFPDGEWIPSSALNFCRSRERLEVTIPDGYDVTSHPLYGKNVAFTGKLQLFTRWDAFHIVELFGGTPQNTVNKNTDILVTGVQDMKKLARGTTESAKLRKAKDLRSKGYPVQIMTDREFQEFVFQVTGTHETLDPVLRRDHE